MFGFLLLAFPHNSTISVVLPTMLASLYLALLAIGCYSVLDTVYIHPLSRTGSYGAHAYIIGLT